MTLRTSATLPVPDFTQQRPPHLPLKPLVVVIGLLASYCAYADEDLALKETSVGAQLDWQPIEVIPSNDRDLRCRQCQGAFVDPLAGSPNVDPLSANMEVSAEDSDVTEEELVFEGDVSVKQGNRYIRADKVRFDRAQQTGIAEGHVTLREPGLVLIGDRATYDNAKQQATVSNARFALHENQLSGSAMQLERNAQGHVTIDKGSMTYCAPDDPSWHLTSDNIVLEPDSGIGEARHAKLYIGDIPVFYVPWIQFPIDDRRKTGVLFPDIGSDTRGGLDVTVPIYLNLAPNYDATYSPRYIGERGLNHQLNGRYLGNKVGFWDVTGAYLSGDKKYRDEIDNTGGERWLIGVTQRGSLGDNWRTRIDYTRVSDPDYIRDLDNQSLSTQRQTALMQLGQVDYLGEDWVVSIQAQEFQSLADDIRNDYKKLPQITAQWRGDADWAGLQPIALAQYSNFDADGERVTGQRLYSEIGLAYPMNWIYGFVKPTVKYRQLDYDLKDSPALQDQKPSAGSGVASVDAGLVFERSLTITGEGMTQTLEPRLFYLYSQYDEQTGQPDFDSAELTFSYNQLYRDTRFSGNDRLDDANQISLGVTTRFFADSDGRERLNASIGQIYYLKDRRVRLKGIDPSLTENSSPIAAEINWLPTEHWDVRSSLLYDTEDSAFDAASIQVGYRSDEGSFLNVGYTLREPPPSLANRPVTEQANISAYYPINDNWRVFGALEYSLEASQAVEDMVGLEYDDCCWQFRVLYMRYVDTDGNVTASDLFDPNLDRENALQFQFVLKGMGGFGGRVDNLLNDMIRGFRDRY
mgnify:CR=1 FL=1